MCSIKVNIHVYWIKSSSCFGFCTRSRECSIHTCKCRVNLHVEIALPVPVVLFFQDTLSTDHCNSNALAHKPPLLANTWAKQTPFAGSNNPFSLAPSHPSEKIPIFTSLIMLLYKLKENAWKVEVKTSLFSHCLCIQKAQQSSQFHQIH